MGRAKRIWYLSPMRAAKVQASLRIRAVSSEPSLLAHTNSESRWTFRQKARSMVPLNGWACAVEICHDGKLEDTNSLDGAQIDISVVLIQAVYLYFKYRYLYFKPKQTWKIKNRFLHFKHCEFIIIPENFIFANIHEFDRSRIQHSRGIFVYIEFT